ncbi:Crp/Fnr family transcriptional regulator [Paenibacillus polymyxa]|uniref:Crp/Fnr family transcriptional regulator n=1 Tax=Paenibacillus polymyxa TaxID=1406 RepID=UPI0023794AFC|nr:Crp/Fnr family transcriptional regulator [Paenibacillus polymyxa]WDM22443.1 Crp/Fnr family transcriptional regulator [Paenibacillus polymyxa]
MQATCMERFGDEAERTGIQIYLTEEHFDLLKDIMSWKKVKAGVMLFREGDDAEQLYYIRSGHVKLRKSTEDGKELILTIQHQGDLIGEFSGIDGEEYSCTAETADVCELGVVLVKDLESLLSKNGEMALQFIQWMAMKQRIMQSRFRDLLLYGKTGALASTLIRASNTCGVAVKDGILLNMKLSHSELGEMIGATRESVNRMLSALKEQGTLDTRDGKIVIHDLKVLRGMCCCPSYGQCAHEICRL